MFVWFWWHQCAVRMYVVSHQVRFYLQNVYHSTYTKFSKYVGTMTSRVNSSVVL